MLRMAVKALSVLVDRTRPPVNGPRILIYHQVGAGSGLQMDVAPHVFRRHMEWLAHHRKVVSLARALDAWTDPGSEELVVVSFDDGYRGVFDHAFPVLAELGLPFTLYLTTEPIETGRPMSGAPPLTWKQIAVMAESGLATIGAHTHTHPDLRDLEPEPIEEELATSNRLIWERLGVEPAHFAYPWGYWSPQADPLVRESYVSAVLGGTASDSQTFDPHRINRFPVLASDGFVFFRERLRGGFRLEEGIRRAVRGYRGP